VARLEGALAGGAAVGAARRGGRRRAARERQGPAERDRQKAEEAKASEPAAESDDDDWVPPPHAVPYGPFLVLAALEQLFAGEWLRLQYDRFFHWVFS
jgi:hypothetical protein